MAETTKHLKERERKLEIYFVNKVHNVLKGEALKLQVIGRRGWMDRLVLLPHGVVHLVELKIFSPDSKLTVMQKLRRKRCMELGQQVFVLWSKNEMRKWVTAAQNHIDKNRMIRENFYEPDYQG